MGCIGSRTNRSAANSASSKNNIGSNGPSHFNSTTRDGDHNTTKNKVNGNNNNDRYHNFGGKKSRHHNISSNSSTTRTKSRLKNDLANVDESPTHLDNDYDDDDDQGATIDTSGATNELLHNCSLINGNNNNNSSDATDSRLRPCNANEYTSTTNEDANSDISLSNNSSSNKKTKKKGKVKKMAAAAQNDDDENFESSNKRDDKKRSKNKKKNSKGASVGVASATTSNNSIAPNSILEVEFFMDSEKTNLEEEEGKKKAKKGKRKKHDSKNGGKLRLNIIAQRGKNADDKIGSKLAYANEDPATSPTIPNGASSTGKNCGNTGKFAQQNGGSSFSMTKQQQSSMNNDNFGSKCITANNNNNNGSHSPVSTEVLLKNFQDRLNNVSQQSKSIKLTDSQLEFFRLLDEKIEMGRDLVETS